MMRWNDRPGVLFAGLAPPVGVQQREPAEAFRAAATYTYHQAAALHDGVCPHCSSTVETTVTACPAHETGTDRLCPTCERSHMTEVWMVCSTCKRGMFPPATKIVLDDPAVTAFYHDHGIDHRFASWEMVRRSVDVGEELVSEDPLSVRYAIPAGDDELRLTVDEEMSVLEVSS